MTQHKTHISSSLALVRRYFPQVNAVIDARKPAIVEVTRQDNALAVKRSHRTCALAIAAKRCFHADGVIIGLTTSFIILKTVAIRYKNAGTVSREITSFDRGAGYDEGKYILSPCSPSAALGTKRAYDSVRHAKDGSGRKPRFRHFTRNVRTSLMTSTPGSA
jgi:hypothetical protein